MKTITRNSNNFLAAVAAVCLASVTIVAHADQAADGLPTRTVRYSDLNLNTQAGAAVLYQRIRNAAKEVCGDVDSLQLARVAAAKPCIDRAVFSSVRSVNNPILTREYNAHIGAAQPIEVAAGK